MREKDAAVYRAAIASDEKNDRGRTYVEQAYFEVALVAGDLWEDITAWFSRIVTWLMENWQEVLKVLLPLLLMLL